MLTNGFLCGIAENLFGSLVPGNDYAIKRLRNDCIIRRFDNSAETRLSQQCFGLIGFFTHGFPSRQGFSEVYALCRTKNKIRKQFEVTMARP
jgi:hypothetical protein